MHEQQTDIIIHVRRLCNKTYIELKKQHTITMRLITTTWTYITALLINSVCKHCVVGQRNGHRATIKNSVNSYMYSLIDMLRWKFHTHVHTRTISRFLQHLRASKLFVPMSV